MYPRCFRGVAFFPFCLNWPTCDSQYSRTEINSRRQTSPHKAWVTWGQSTLSRLLLITSQNASAGQWLGGVQGCPAEWVSLGGGGGHCPLNRIKIGFLRALKNTQPIFRASQLFTFYLPRNNEISIRWFPLENLTVHLAVNYLNSGAHSSASNHSFTAVNTSRSSSVAVVLWPSCNTQRETLSLNFPALSGVKCKDCFQLHKELWAMNLQRGAELTAKAAAFTKLHKCR